MTKIFYEMIKDAALTNDVDSGTKYILISISIFFLSVSLISTVYSIKNKKKLYRTDFLWITIFDMVTAMIGAVSLMISMSMHSASRFISLVGIVVILVTMIYICIDIYRRESLLHSIRERE